MKRFPVTEDEVKWRKNFPKRSKCRKMRRETSLDMFILKTLREERMDEKEEEKEAEEERGSGEERE